jgi:hypothetical protein
MLSQICIHITYIYNYIIMILYIYIMYTHHVLFVYVYIYCMDRYRFTVINMETAAAPPKRCRHGGRIHIARTQLPQRPVKIGI